MNVKDLIKDGYQLLRQTDDGFFDLVKKYPTGERHTITIKDLDYADYTRKN